MSAMFNNRNEREDEEHRHYELMMEMRRIRGMLEHLIQIVDHPIHIRDRGYGESPAATIRQEIRMMENRDMARRMFPEVEMNPEPWGFDPSTLYGEKKKEAKDPGWDK